jgi:hypothetical protein
LSGVVGSSATRQTRRSHSDPTRRIGTFVALWADAKEGQQTKLLDPIQRRYERLSRRIPFTWRDLLRHLLFSIVPLYVIGVVDKHIHGDPLLWLAWIGGSIVAFAALLIAGHLVFGDRVMLLILGQRGTEGFFQQMTDKLSARGYDTSHIQARHDEVKTRNTHKLPPRSDRLHP